MWKWPLNKNQKKIIAFFLVVIALGFFIQSQQLSKDDCVIKYAPQAKSDVVAQMVQAACSVLNDKDLQVRKNARCTLKEVLKTKNDAAAQAVFAACTSRNIKNNHN